MNTECNTEDFDFQPLGRRDVIARFDGGAITSDAGALLLRELEEKTGILRRFAECFNDYRDPELIEHTVEDLVKQRVFGIALGYENLNDHDDLRHDPLLAVLVGKRDPTGEDRVRQRDKGKALAGKSTLNRLELTPAGASASSRYKKIVAECSTIADFFVEEFLNSYDEPPEEIILDFDPTDDQIHGSQLGRFFQGSVNCQDFINAVDMRVRRWQRRPRRGMWCAAPGLRFPSQSEPRMIPIAQVINE